MSSDICWNARTGKKEVCRPPTCSCASFQLYYLWNSSMQFHSRAECSVTFAGMPSRKDLAVVGLRRGVFRFSNCGDVLFRILSRVRTMDHRCRRQLLLCRLHFLLGCTNDSFRLYFSLFWPFSWRFVFLLSIYRRPRRLHGSSTGYRVCTKHSSSRKSDLFGIGSMSYPRWLPSLQAKTWFWFSACTIVAANAKAVESNSPSSTFSAVLSFSFFVIHRSSAAFRRMFTSWIIDSTRFWIAQISTGAAASWWR